MAVFSILSDVPANQSHRTRDAPLTFTDRDRVDFTVDKTFQIVSVSQHLYVYRLSRRRFTDVGRFMRLNPSSVPFKLKCCLHIRRRNPLPMWSIPVYLKNKTTAERRAQTRSVGYATNKIGPPPRKNHA